MQESSHSTWYIRVNLHTLYNSIEINRSLMPTFKFSLGMSFVPSPLLTGCPPLCRKHQQQQQHRLLAPGDCGLSRWHHDRQGGDGRRLWRCRPRQGLPQAAVLGLGRGQQDHAAQGQHAGGEGRR
jgi:hypothetical protein